MADYKNNHYVQEAIVKLFSTNGSVYLLENNNITNIAFNRFLCADDYIYPYEIETHKKLRKLENNITPNLTKTFNKLNSGTITANLSKYFIEYLITNYLRNVIYNEKLNKVFNTKLNRLEIQNHLIELKNFHIQNKKNHKYKDRYGSLYEIINYMNSNKIDYFKISTKKEFRKHKKLIDMYINFYDNDCLFNNKNHIRTHPLEIFLNDEHYFHVKEINNNYIKYFFYSTMFDNFILPQPPTIIIDDNLKKSNNGILNANLLGVISPKLLIGIFKHENIILNYFFKNNIITYNNNRIVNITNISGFDFLNKILFEASPNNFTLCKYHSDLNKL